MRVLLALLLLLLALPAYGQRRALPSRAVPAELTEEETARLARLRLARSFLSGGQVARGITLFEDLHAEAPGDQEVYNELVRAYEAVKRYKDAIDLVDQARARSIVEAEPQLLAHRARLQYLDGDHTGAAETWARVIDGAQDQERIYRLVYESMIQVRLLDQAIVVLLEGRKRTGRPTLFQTELAHLYSLLGSHAKAMEEFLALLESNARQINYVRGRFGQSLQQQGALDAVLPMVAERVRENPGQRSFRELYAWLLMESGAFEKALVEYRTLSRDETLEGRLLFDFASQAADAAAYDVAAVAYEELLRSYGDDPVAADAQLGLAAMHRLHADRLEDKVQAKPHYEAALAAYNTFASEFPGHARHAEAARQIAALQQTVFLNLDAAEQTLQHVARQYRGTLDAFQARFDLGRLAVQRNRLAQAHRIFESLESELPSVHELFSAARFERAQIAFYQGRLQHAGELLRALRQQSTSEVANDAIALRVLLLENPGPDSANGAVKQYAAAALLFRQHAPEKAVSLLDSVLGHWGQHPIADDARLLRAASLHAAGQIDAALLAFGELPLIHEESPLADRSLYQYAKILEEDLGRMQDALDTYRMILTQYPGSLLIPKVRERIRALRTEGA